MSERDRKDIVEVGHGEERAIIADDSVIALAKQAEARIEAVKKIKQTALKVTNPDDWVDQQGKPYLMASGSEKIANLFSVSWGFLDPEPKYEEDEEGHYTYTFRGVFTMGSRSVECEGSRSSRDKFFIQYDYKGDKGVKTERPLADRDNKRDVKMAALTNLLGNGITRILGIRNLTWVDLAASTEIKQADVGGKVTYKKKDPGTLKEPRENGEKKPEIKDPNAPATESQVKAITAILNRLKYTDDYARMERVSEIIGKDGEPLTSASALTKGQASEVIGALQEEGSS